jgi:ankyrin repeat protein
MEFNTVDSPNIQQLNDLQDAIMDDDIEKVQQLIAQGANVNACKLNKKSNVPLCLALDNPEIMELLLKAGADANANVYYTDTASGSEGDTLLIKATHDGNIPAIKLLLKYGANPFIQNKEGKTAVNIVTRMLSQQNALPKFLRARFITTYTTILELYNYKNYQKTYKELLLTQRSSSSPVELQAVPKDIVRHILWILTGLLQSQVMQLKNK